VNVLGSLLLSILAGHSRYAHITSLMGDCVNTKLLGMTKVVSDDSARRALWKIEEEDGIPWLQDQLAYCYSPLLSQPWILDADVTVKPLYGKQEGAVVGYNPHKPGRPSHTYHTYMIANLRLILEVEVQAGDQSSSACWRRLKTDHPYRLKIDQGELLNSVLYSIGIVDQTELVLPPFFY
jgi:hypothetical protein